MRLLLSTDESYRPGQVVDGEAALRDLYVAPARRWLRANFISTLDGASAGKDGLSGTINTAADGMVFAMLRRLSDVVVVGAGTVRAEGYSVLREHDRTAPVLAVVSNTGRLPDKILHSTAPRGSVLLITCASADPTAIAAAHEAIGDECVITTGTDGVDLVAARHVLEDRGHRQILTEGGPHLLGSMLAAGVVDELALSWAPTIVAGSQPRIIQGEDLAVRLSPLLLMEQDGTLLGRWRVRH